MSGNVGAEAPKKVNEKAKTLMDLPEEELRELRKKADDFDLNQHTVRLMRNEPFYAYFSRIVDKRKDYSIPTAAIYFDEEEADFCMIYNPIFMVSLEDKHKAGVIIHEFQHMIYEHITSRFDASVDPMIFNVAADLANNSLIERELLPEFCLYPGEGEFTDYPSAKTVEFYLSKIMKDERFQNEEGEVTTESLFSVLGDGGAEGQPTLDSHESWSEKAKDLPQSVKDAIKARVNSAITEAGKKCMQSNSWGSISSAMKEKIKKMISNEIDWRKALRYFINTSVRADKKSTIRRINRRFPYTFPGRKVTRRAKIAISVDQSGSVSHEMLALFAAEVNNLSSFVEFDWIPFDTAVLKEHIFTWKKGESKVPERVQCGGTDFNAPTNYVNDADYDGHIIATDMQAPKPGKSRCPRLWITTQSCYDHMPFKTKEKVLVIKKNDPGW